MSLRRALRYVSVFAHTAHNFRAKKPFAIFKIVCIFLFCRSSFVHFSRLLERLSVYNILFMKTLRSRTANTPMHNGISMCMCTKKVYAFLISSRTHSRSYTFTLKRLCCVHILLTTVSIQFGMKMKWNPNEQNLIWILYEKLADELDKRKKSKQMNERGKKFI